MIEKEKILDKYRIYEVDFKNISDGDMNDIYGLTLERWEESYFMLPKPTFENEKHEYTHNHPSDIASKYIIRDNTGELVAATTISRIKPEIDAPEDEKNRGWISISVRKEFRRVGVGTETLKFLTGYAHEKNLKKLQVFTSMDEGVKFCERFKGEITGRSYFNYLDFRNLDTKKFQRIMDVIQKENPGISISTSVSLKDSDREKYLKLLCEFAEDISIYSPEWNYDEKFFLEMTLENEQVEKEKGIARLFSHARTENGEIIGMSELHYNPKKPKEIYTEITGVTKDYRKRGIAKLLKIKLFLFAKEMYPDIEILLTENDEGNSNMRKINHDFGFKNMPIQTEYTFKIDTLKKLFDD